MELGSEEATREEPQRERERERETRLWRWARAPQQANKRGRCKKRERLLEEKVEEDICGAGNSDLLQSV
jgi:hypothetical protein